MIWRCCSRTLRGSGFRTNTLENEKNNGKHSANLLPCVGGVIIERTTLPDKVRFPGFVRLVRSHVCYWIQTAFEKQCRPPRRRLAKGGWLQPAGGDAYHPCLKRGCQSPV